jgi:two-component system cell cycle response regulator DivK
MIAPAVLVAVDDLFFWSRIESVAASAGVSVVQAADAQRVENLLALRIPRLIIFDLNSRLLHPLETIARIKADPRLSSIPLVGFFSHVQRDLERRARDAGCDQVLPRSVFTARLGEILVSSGPRREI